MTQKMYRELVYISSMPFQTHHSNNKSCKIIKINLWSTVKLGKMQLLRVKCTVKKHKLEAIFFVEKWTEVTQNMHKANTDKIYFWFNFSDRCSLHLDALHFTRFDGIFSRKMTCGERFVSIDLFVNRVTLLIYSLHQIVIGWLPHFNDVII